MNNELERSESPQVPLKRILKNSHVQINTYANVREFQIDKNDYENEVRQENEKDVSLRGGDSIKQVEKYKNKEISRFIQHIVAGISPLLRILVALAQMQFIFLNSSEFDMGLHTIICRFGLMHCLATNICEWLFIIFKETEEAFHRIEHNSSNEDVGTMEVITEDSGPFLFPCTVEYSLICATIMYEMWKRIDSIQSIVNARKSSTIYFQHRMENQNHNKSHVNYQTRLKKNQNKLVPCALIFALTIIIISIYKKFQSTTDDGSFSFSIMAIFVIILLCSSLIIIFKAFYDTHPMGQNTHLHSNLIEKDKLKFDSTLLLASVYGAFTFHLFSLFGSIFELQDHSSNMEILGIIMDVLSIIEISMQTVFILHVTWKKDHDGAEKGKIIISYLLILNVAMWIINVAVTNKHDFRKEHENHFTIKGWITIVQMTLPSAIFYRFHSAICLYEILKLVYGKDQH
uniref:CSON015008 protein n=1 Tax=Culicoides sonorensis TaxID=179676 RepID=A0A336MCC8_CULSO